MIVFVILLIVGFVSFLIYEGVNLSVTGFPPKDEDVLEFIEKVRKSNPFLLDGAKPGCMLCSSGNPYISKSLSTCLMGYYIKDVGAIPIWYKSYGEIQKLYVELGENSSKTKREKLGL
jgi:hypothetical protein